MTLGVLQAMSAIVALTLTLTMSPFVEALKGGESAKPGEFPHAVQLSSSKTGKVFCGGSIFSPNVVITAAHCVHLKKSLDPFRQEPSSSQDITLVWAGSLENREKKEFKKSGIGMVQMRTVYRYVIHPSFNSSSYENDIALLILGDPLNFTDNVKAIQLPPPNATYSRGTLLGWGYTYKGNLSSPYLKKIELVFEDRDSCNSDPLMMIDPKERNVTDLELCTKWRKGNSPCQRDSGSSIICQGSNSTLHNNETSNSSPSPTICGFASFGTGIGLCGKSDKIGVFVDVSKYVDWIQKEAEKNVDAVKTMKLFEKIDFCITVVFECIFMAPLFLLLFLVCILIVDGVGFLFISCFSKIKKMCLSRATSESQVA